MSQDERKERQAEAAAQQAAEILRWRKSLGIRPLALHVASCFPPVPIANRCWAAHWVIAAQRQAELAAAGAMKMPNGPRFRPVRG